MPKGFFRLLAVLLLALAIPVQGIAAVVKAQCMSVGHHPDTGHHEQQGHAHDGAGGDGHTKAPAQPNCGPCAACCAAAAAAASAPRLSFEPDFSPPCCNPSALASVSLDTPERPPLVG
jgi:hypothetical protein